MQQRDAELLALQEEREKRLQLERRLAEETMRRDELVEQEIRLREQQRHQVSEEFRCQLGLHGVYVVIT